MIPLEASRIEELTPVLQAFAKNGECVFYSILEDEKKCGSSGYLMSSGFKYCKLFQDYNDRNNNEVIIFSKNVIFLILIYKTKGQKMDRFCQSLYNDRVSSADTFKL